MCYPFIFVSKKNKLTLGLPLILIQFLLPQYLYAAKQSFDFTPVVNSYAGQQQVFAINMGSVLPGPGASLPDLVLYDNHTLHVLFNNQDISYPVVPNLLPTASNPYGIQSAMAFNVGSAADFGGATGISIALDEELVSVVDMNNDGLGDLLTYKEGPINDEMKVYLNAGNTFSAPSVISFLHRTWLFHTAELNNNPGALEILGYDDVTGNVYVLNTGNPNQALLNIGPGLLSAGLTFYYGNFCPGAFKDIGYSYSLGGNVYFEVMENPNGSSLTAQPGLTIGPLAATTQFFAGNFNPDNLTDLLTYLPGSGQESVRLNNGNNSFDIGNVWNTLSTSNSFQLHAADFSGDQLTDMLALQVNVVNSPLPSGYGDIYLDINAYVPSPGISTFAENQWGFGAVLGFPQNWPCALLSADFNGDGRHDVLVYNAPEGLIKVGINAPHLEGYCWPISAKNDGNQSIDFFIQGNGQHTVTIHKYTSENNSVTASPALATYSISPVSQYIPTEASIKANGCQWPHTFSVTIPSNWESGFYAAKLVDVFGREDFVTFIVKAATPSCTKVALIANTNTWQAYNRWDGTNLDYNYTGSGSKYSSQDAIYSFMRPCQTARPDVYNYEVFNNDNAYSMLMQRARAELWIYTWLYQNGYEPDVITDQDLHENTGQFINQYAFLIMGTHPEYWTAQMYDHAKQFQQYGAGTHGGNLICLGGNSVFEACDLDLTQAANPRIVFYPTPVASPGSPFPLSNPNSGVGGESGGSPYWNSNANAWWPDRFDYFLEYYLFPDQVPRRSIDLIGTHYNVINNVQENTTSSYTKTALGQSSSIMANVNGSELGTCGYNNGYSLQTGQNAAGKAAGRETDIYGLSVVGGVKMPPSNTQLPSVYSATIQVLARSTDPLYNPTNVSFNNFPNGLNESEIIYVPAEPAPANRGFVFTAGSVTFGGSLVCDANLSQMMHNVMHLDGQLPLSAQNMGCNNSGGSIQASNCFANGNNYVLQPGNLTNSTGYFSGLAAGIYTVTCTDAMGYTQTGTAEIMDPATGNFCCGSNANPNSGANLVSMPGMHLLVSPLASAIINLLGNIGTGFISGKLLYIDGPFTVDAAITFNNCHFWFTPNAQVLLNGPYQLNFNQCTLQASCDWWGGLVANDAQQKVVVENNSTIRNASTGITMLNGALLEASNSNFEDNGMQCIRFGNIATSNYAGFVKGCTFTTAQNLPAPFSKTQFGIYSINNKSLTIGGLGTGEGNTFDEMQTGIWAGLSDNTLNPVLKVYNNAFANIHDDYTNAALPDVDLINNCYNTYKGTAIMAYYGGPAMANSMVLDVQNSGPANPGIAFSHCDRGIVTVQGSLKAENLYMDHVVMGMMNFNVIGNSTASGGSNHFDIQHNELHNTYLGMQFAGTSANSIIHHNIINCTLYPSGIQTIPPGQLGLNFIWPKGIDLSDYSSNNSYNLAVTENTISMPHYAGVGINSLQGGSGLAIKDNTINLSSTDAGQVVCGGATHLLGIASAQAIGTRVHNNTISANTFVLNNTPNDASLRIDAAGILIDHGQDQAIGCNAIIGARFGLMAYSENNTNTGNELLVQGNTVSNANAGWVFRHLATEGTLGQVGDPGNDNNNVFPGMPAGGPKVFKFCLSSDPFQIFTTSINQLTESLSENMNTLANDCPYLIQTNPGATVFNPDPQGSDCGGLQIAGPWNGSDIPLDEALAIATDTKVYVEFPALAHWYDCKRLYEYLIANQNLLNSFPVLDSFYTAVTNNAIAQIEAADQQMRNLIQSFDIYTPAQREAMLTYIENTNNGIDYTEEQNENEKEINRIYLKLVRYGMDSLAEADKGFISTLAPQCPYVGGSAVYKARSLNYYLHPGAMYDDMKVCNAVGVYKQGNANNGSTKSLITMENEALAQIKANPEKAMPENNDVYVYPVPAHSYIHVNYAIEEDATFILYNAVGEKLVVDKLSKENTTQRIDLHSMANGIYNYEVLFANKLKSIGKISIIN